MSKVALLLLLTLCWTSSSGCGAALRYPQGTVQQLGQAWQDAFNRDEQGQLTLMVHPDRRETFEQYALDVKAQLDRYTITRYELGATTKVEGGRVGRLVTFYMIDTRADADAEPIDNESVLVEADGRWWLWRY